MERRSVERRNRTRRKKDNNLPLITYTPNYKELECTVKIKEGRFAPPPWPQDNPKYIEVTFKLPKAAFEWFYKPPSDFTVHFQLDKDEDAEKVKERVSSIVFCAFIQKSPQASHIGPGILQELVMLDNCGNKYHIQATRPPGNYNPVYGSDGVEFLTFYRVHHSNRGNKKSVLPDSMIDYLIENETALLGPRRHTKDDFNITHYILPIKTSSRVKPHRKFEPTADLAEYIEDLEMLPTLMNEDLQKREKIMKDLVSAKRETLMKEVVNAKRKRLMKDLVSAKLYNRTENQARIEQELKDFQMNKANKIMKKYEKEFNNI